MYARSLLLVTLTVAIYLLLAIRAPNKGEELFFQRREVYISHVEAQFQHTGIFNSDAKIFIDSDARISIDVDDDLLVLDALLLFSCENYGPGDVFNDPSSLRTVATHLHPSKYPETGKHTYSGKIHHDGETPCRVLLRWRKAPNRNMTWTEMSTCWKESLAPPISRPVDTDNLSYKEVMISEKHTGTSTLLTLRKKLPDNKQITFIDGDEIHKYFWQKSKLRFPGIELYEISPTPMSSSSERSPVKILFIGDSEMRTTFQAFIANMGTKLGSKGRPFIDYPDKSGEFQRRSWCKHQWDNNVEISGGLLNITGDGCWGGHVRFILKGVVELVYISMTSVQARWERVHFKPDVTFLATAHHDQNSPIDHSYIRKLQQRNSDILSYFPSTKLVLVSSWTSDLTKRPLFWCRGCAARQNIMLEQFKADSRVRTLSLLDFTAPVQESTPDGIHLTYPHPLSEIARVFEHNVCALLHNVKDKGHKACQPLTQSNY